MANAYLDALAELKSSFVAGKDKMVVAGFLAQRFNSEHIRLLDVGIGDGTDVRKVCEVLSSSDTSVEVTGIDPLSSSIIAVRESLPSANVIRATLSTYDPTNEGFDVVHCRHALYYESDWRQAIMKMRGFLRTDRALLVINLWSRECSLYQLHRELVGEHYACVTAEEVADYIVSDWHTPIETVRCVGEVDGVVPQAETNS